MERVGQFLKYVGALIVLAFSVSLGYTFFNVIAPSNMPWFTWVALGLTEVGFIIWLFTFRTTSPSDPKKPVALVMVLVCLFATLYTDAMELARMFHAVTIFANMYYYALIGLLLVHFVAIVIDEFINENTKFQRLKGYAAEPYYIPQQQEQVANYQEGYLPQASYTRPLAERSNQTGETLSQKAGYLVKGVVGTLMEKGRNSTNGGRMAVPVPGEASETTSENTSTSGTQTADGLHESINELEEVITLGEEIPVGAPRKRGRPKKQ